MVTNKINYLKTNCFRLYIIYLNNLYKPLFVSMFIMAKEKKKEITLTDLPGIGPALAEKLEAAGFSDVLSIAVLSIKELEEIAGLTEATARKTIQAARKMMDLGFKDAKEYLKEREEMTYISTGSKNLDELLGGKGVETSAVTEAYGAYGSGKSQIAHSLSVHAQLPKKRGGAEGNVVFIDSEGTFRPERIKLIAEALGLDQETVLKNIFVARAFNSDHQMLLVEKIPELIKEKKIPVKLVVIDSLTSHFRAEFSGRGQLADRQQKLNKHIHSLVRLAEQYKVAVYITNQVMANPGVLFGDPTTAIGGHIVGHASHYRMYLRRGKKGSRVAKMIDAPNLPENEAIFWIAKEGLTDSEVKGLKE